MYLHSESLATIFNNVTTDDVLLPGEEGEAGVGCSGVGVGLGDAAATAAGWSAGSAIRITVIAKGGEGQQGVGGGAYDGGGSTTFQ